MMRVIFVLLSLFSSFANAYSPVCQQRHCVAIVDAGSTGSRLHLYAYDIDDNQTPIDIEQKGSKKTTPGFGSLDPKHVDTYLTTLFADAPEQNVPVFFYATAGMRLVPQTRQQHLYQAVQSWFTMHPEWRLQESKTISGKQEGVFGWLAVNYKLGTLQADNKPLVSVMDMGGASVQIVTPVEHTEAIAPNDTVQLDVYKRHLTLFVHSFLGLGQTEVAHHYLNATHCFPYDYLLPNESTGEGDAQACQQDISKLINSVHGVNQLVQPLLKANPPTSWYAVSGLGYLARNKALNFANHQFTNQDLLQQADNEFCHQLWPALSKQSEGNEYAFINCLSASYYYSLLVNGYGLHPNQLINFMPDEEEPDWTIGVVLQQPLS